ncbi:MAG: hypothetical protein NZ874_08855 [Fimbriimonadales bacterium]|nr:hypothetical protein [Fimbriimonadales bacterium]
MRPPSRWSTPARRRPRHKPDCQPPAPQPHARQVGRPCQPQKQHGVRCQLPVAQAQRQPATKQRHQQKEDHRLVPHAPSLFHIGEILVKSP